MENYLIKIGCMGCAKIAERSFLPAIKSMPKHFKLIAIASRTLSKAIKFSNQFQCEPVLGYQNLLARQDIDAIYMPLPTGMHHEWMAKSIKAGKHIYAEKSFASNLNQTKELLSLAKKKNIALMEGYMFLYHKQFKKIQSFINNKELGELRHFNGAFGFPPLEIDNFRYDEKIGGGVLMDAAGYPLIASNKLFGNQLEIKAATMYLDDKLNTYLWGSAFLSNSKGFGGSISFGFDNNYQCSFGIWGSKAHLFTNRIYTAGINHSPEIIISRNNQIETIKLEQDNHFIASLMHFRNIIKNNKNRQDSYQQILNQSKSLEKIREISSQK